MKENSIFENSDSLLDGASGIVYLLFVKRDNYAQNIQGLMTKVLFADRSNVNQAMHRLIKEGNRFFVSKGSMRIERKPGRAREIYTANLEPITNTLRRLNVKYDKNQLFFALDRLSIVSDFFPKFLTNMYQKHIIRRFQWYQTLSYYFLFLSTAIKSTEIISYPFPANFKVDKQEVEELLKTYPSLSKELMDLFSQLNSPNHYYNPKYVEQLNAIADQFSSKESEAMKSLQFLKGIQELGITDFSVLLSQLQEVRAIFEKRDELWAKLNAAEIKLQNKQENSPP